MRHKILKKGECRKLRKNLQNPPEKIFGYFCYGLHDNSQRFEQNQIKNSPEYVQKTVDLFWNSGGNRHTHISFYSRGYRQQPRRLTYDGDNVTTVSVGDV